MPTEEEYLKIRIENANRIVESYRSLLSEGIERVIQYSKEQIISRQRIDITIPQLEYLIGYLADYPKRINLRECFLDRNLEVNYDTLECEALETEIKKMFAEKRRAMRWTYKYLEEEHGIPAKAFQRAEDIDERLTYAKLLQIAEVYFKDEPLQHQQAIEIINSLAKNNLKRVGKRYGTKNDHK